MKRAILYSSTIVLYLLTLFCARAILGIAVSKKYEVEEAYLFIEIDKKLTDEQKVFEKEKLDIEGDRLDNKVALFIIAGLASFVLATGLLLKGKKLIAGNKATESIGI